MTKDFLEWILFKYYLIDRIYRMNRIISRFPDETEKTGSTGKLTIS